jgi:hypothetical protein
MKLEFLIDMCKKRLNHLTVQRASASEIGDISQIERIDAEITSTQTTLNQLTSLI